MLLIYDSKCSICRNLAQRIHRLSRESVGIRPLSSPEAHRVLEEHYPEGWSHDFYVVANGKCRKGVRALPRLTKNLGLKNMASVMAEYGSYRLAAARATSNGNGMKRSKRDLLKFAALAPFVYGFSKLPTEDREASQADGLLVHVAEVEKLGGEIRVRTYRCDDCLRPPEKLKGVPAGSAVHPIEDKFLAEGPVSGLELLKGQSASHRIKRVQYERETVRGTEVSRDLKTIHSSMLEHSRYNLALNFGQGFRTMAAGMAQHDLPVPALDFVVFKTDTEDAVEYFAAYAAAVRALAKLHAHENRSELSRVYLDMARGLVASGPRFEETVGRSIVPGRNEFVVTSMPEALKFAQLPEHLRVATKAEADEGGCDCSCSCGICCGCGCGLGLCIGPSPCDCDCCIGCGCGCGCCL